MEREIQVGGARFVVDDPRGAMGTTHPEAVKAVQLGLETARTRDEEAGPFGANGRPNPNDPIGGIAARASLVEGMVTGRTKPWTLWLGWFFSAIGVYSVAGVILALRHSMIAYLVAGAMLLGHTVFFISALATMQMRRDGKKTVYDR